MLDVLLPLLRSMLAELKDTPAGAQIQADLASIEGIAAKHADALAADVAEWVKARLYAIGG
jgi:hypothetical protein